MRPQLSQVVLTVVVLTAAAAAARAESFDPGCSLPFASIAKKRQIDKTCGREGNPTGSDDNHAQNAMKNNFCATGDPAEVTILTFKQLQKAVDEAQPPIPFGNSARLPPDRSRLHDVRTTSNGDTIGEESVVRFVGFVVDAHYSNVSKGESVNCTKPGKPTNDIHIALAETFPQDVGAFHLCNTITAEITPHSRPELWDTDALNRTRRKHHPVRLTGQLFFDGSHLPCRPGKEASPARTSVWEIHPIYAVDVCENTTVAACQVDSESKWKPLHEWISLEEEGDQ